MLREAFTVRLKTDSLTEWRKRHQDIWPELAEAERQCGVVWMSIFESDPILFVYSEVLRDTSWDELIATDVHKRWVEWMAPLMESAQPDDTVNRHGLPEVFHRVYMPELLGRT